MEVSQGPKLLKYIQNKELREKLATGNNELIEDIMKGLGCTREVSQSMAAEFTDKFIQAHHRNDLSASVEIFRSSHFRDPNISYSESLQ